MKKWFINLKIGGKIICGFLLVAVIAGIIGAIGIVSLEHVGGSYNVAYSDTVTALECMERVSASFQEVRTDLLEMVLSSNKADKEACVEALTRHRGIIDDNLSKYKGTLEKYKAEEVEEELKLIFQLESALNGFTEGRNRFISSPAATDPEHYMEAYSMLSDGGELHTLGQAVEEMITVLVKYNQDYAKQQIDINDKLVASVKIIMYIGVLMGVVLAVLVGLFIARGISKRIGLMVEAADKLACGEVNVNIEANSRDEIGVLAQNFRRMSGTLKLMITDAAYLLEELADGNFTVYSKAEESYVGDYFSLLDSMGKMRDTLSNTLKSIDVAADQVATGSDQVSSGAQALASGSTQQAASVEELSASIEKIAEQAAENSATVALASESVNQAGEDANAGNEHMEQLTAAMADIGSASDQIASITKVIEDIAFQTNILALNAAIEAARAGSAGKGFAVVANEVRNLAGKSAEAAKQTSDLIQASVSTVAKGTEITARTVQILQDVGTSALKVTESFGKIQQSSAEQAVAIKEIKQGLFQISAVVQTNAATAEENSATSEEMSAQAAALRGEVGKFKLAGDMGLSSVRSYEEPETEFELRRDYLQKM
ncbi:HAMP domain-containing methyl-accepting chemotaxis protein [Lacrimispora brassicae]